MRPGGGAVLPSDGKLDGFNSVRLSSETDGDMTQTKGAIMKKQLVNKRRFSSLQAIVHFHGPSTNSEHTSEQVLAKQIAGTLPTLYHTIDNTSTPSYK